MYGECISCLLRERTSQQYCQLLQLVLRVHNFGSCLLQLNAFTRRKIDNLVSLFMVLFLIVLVVLVTVLLVFQVCTAFVMVSNCKFEISLPCSRRGVKNACFFHQVHPHNIWACDHMVPWGPPKANGRSRKKYEGREWVSGKRVQCSMNAK